MCVCVCVCWYRLDGVGTHQHPLYPMTGAIDSEQATAAADVVQNFVLEAGADSAAWRRLYDDAVLPRLREFAPVCN